MDEELLDQTPDLTSLFGGVAGVRKVPTMLRPKANVVDPVSGSLAQLAAKDALAAPYFIGTLLRNQAAVDENNELLMGMNQAMLQASQPDPREIALKVLQHVRGDDPVKTAISSALLPSVIDDSYTNAAREGQQAGTASDVATSYERAAGAEKHMKESGMDYGGTMLWDIQRRLGLPESLPWTQVPSKDELALEGNLAKADALKAQATKTSEVTRQRKEPRIVSYDKDNKPIYGTEEVTEKEGQGSKITGPTDKVSPSAPEGDPQSQAYKDTAQRILSDVQTSGIPSLKIPPDPGATIEAVLPKAVMIQLSNGSVKRIWYPGQRP